VALFLALYLAAFSGRPLTVTLLYGVRTFLPLSPCSAEAVTITSDCLACFTGVLYRDLTTLPKFLEQLSFPPDAGNIVFRIDKLLIRPGKGLIFRAAVLTLSLWERVGGEAGVSDGMPSACLTVSACKRIRALQVRGSGSNTIRSGSIICEIRCRYFKRIVKISCLQSLQSWQPKMHSVPHEDCVSPEAFDISHKNP
jgi:hypothetical protein